MPKRYIIPTFVKTKLFSLHKQFARNGGWKRVAEEIGFLSGGYWWFIAHEQRQLTKANYMRFMARFGGEGEGVSELPPAEPMIIPTTDRRPAEHKRRPRRIEDMSRQEMILALRWREPYHDAVSDRS